MKKELLVVCLFYSFFYYTQGFVQPSIHPQYVSSTNSKSNKPHNPQNKPTNTQTTYTNKSTAIVYKPVLHAPVPNTSEEKVPPMTEEDFHFQLQWYVISETQNIKPNTPYEAKIWGNTYVYWKDQYNQYYAIQNICNHRGAALSKGCINTETNCIQCPYHGLEFDGKGILKKIPGQLMGPKPMPSLWNQACYPIIEKEGWIYLNIISEEMYNSNKFSQNTLKNTLYTEPEAFIQSSSRVFCNIPSVPTYARIVSENLLDILHITYVHSFGNKDSPTPLNEPIPYKLRAYNKDGILTSFSHSENQSIAPIDNNTCNDIVPKKNRKNKEQRVINTKTRAILFRNQMFSILNPISTISKKWLLHTEKNKEEIPLKTNPTVQQTINETIPSKNQHYGIRYLFETNPNSVIRKVFHYNHIVIETEFLLPHLTVSRVRFGPFYKTVVAFTLPVTEKETHLFIKLYRNYWVIDSIPSLPFPFSLFSYLLGLVIETVSDGLMLWMLKETFKEDAGILERLTNDVEQEGKYNLKYDKFPYLYRNLYKKYIHNKENNHNSLFPPFFSVLPQNPQPFLLDKIDNNTSFTPLNKQTEHEITNK